MGLGLAEVRERAQRLKAAVARERYEIKAGLKERPDLCGLYEAHALVTSLEAVPAVQRALASASGDERQRLRWLLAWIAEQRVEAALAGQEDEYRAWEAATALRTGDGEVPLRSAVAHMKNESRRPRRLALERLRHEKLEEAIPLQVDMLYREREAVAELGFGPPVEARERLACLAIRALQREAVRLLTATEEAYRELLTRHAVRRLEIRAEDATRADVWWLRRMAWMDPHFHLDRVLAAVRRDLAELGLPLGTDGEVRLDREARPLKASRSFCAALEVPGEVVLVMPRSGGWAEAESLLHELGHALHFAYTSPGLPFEYRVLGDTAVTETYALLFELLALEPSWLRRAAGLGDGQVGEYLPLATFLKLHRLRRHAARLLYEVELHDAEAPGRMGERYAELMSGATGVRYDERTFLEDVDRGFWVARQLRAWMLAALLGAQLRERYDADWYRNPGAGPFLGELLSAGQRDDASQLARQFGAERLGSEALLDQVESWLP